jgi:hypothetical protein
LKNLNDLLKKLDPKMIEEGKKKAEELSKSPEGKALIEKLSDNGQLSLSNLKNFSESDAEPILKFMSQNPDLAKKLESFFKKE